jgi:hypothetical protein
MKIRVILSCRARGEEVPVVGWVTVFVRLAESLAVGVLYFPVLCYYHLAHCHFPSSRQWQPRGPSESATMTK